MLGELGSWKEIASYLGVSVKTAQVWERTRGLPVRRLPGPRAQVRALVPELEAWRLQPPDEVGQELAAVPAPVATPESLPVDRVASVSWWRPRRAWLFGILLLLLVVVGVRVLASRGGGLSSLRVDRDGLSGLDGAGRVLWRYPTGVLDLSRYSVSEQRTWLGDLDGDGNVEVLFVPQTLGFVRESVPLVCLDVHGRERWRYNPGKTITRHGEVFAPPFIARQFAILNGRIVVTSFHHLYAPAQVSLLDHDGRLLREYWHPGHVNRLTTGTYQGRPVAFLGGINNPAHAATVVVLDPDTMAGAATVNGSPAYDGMNPGVSVVRLLFSRSCLNATEPYNEVVNITNNAQGSIVDVHEELDIANPASIHYHLNPDLSLRDILLSDKWIGKHAKQATHTVDAELARLRIITPAK